MEVVRLATKKGKRMLDDEIASSQDVIETLKQCGAKTVGDLPEEELTRLGFERTSTGQLVRKPQGYSGRE